MDDITSIPISLWVQRKHIGELLGQIRDLEFEWTDEAIQRVTTENITLKQCGRQLSTDNRILDDRLKAPARTCDSAWYPASYPRKDCLKEQPYRS